MTVHNLYLTHGALLCGHMIVILTQAAISALVRWDNGWEHYQGRRLITCCHQYITDLVIIQRSSDE